ncbi:MAG TPA: protein kinase, partial [Gemmatimonadales bacterium]
MATVWLARDLKHERLVALKVLHPALSATLGPERFLREIKLAARLQHPHVVPVYDSGESAAPIAGSGSLWYTMPYVDGESLRDRLRREGALAPPEAVRIAVETAQALSYAHGQGVVHRDIKPENILLARDGSTLVADFGIARPFGATADPGLTMAGMIVGTPAYMSPEQAAGGSVGPAADIYSLGCVLYEMLAGRPPFTGQSGQAVMVRHMTEPVPILDPRATKAPPAVSRVVARAMAKSAAERFATAAEFAEALREAFGRSTPGIRRALPAAALGALVLAGTLLATWRSRDQAALAGAGEALASGFNRTLSQITFGQGVEEWPAWAPDGRRLAFVAEVDGFRQLFVRDLATGTDRRLLTDTRDHVQPTWAPDGARLAYVRGRGVDRRLGPSDLDGYYFEYGDIWSLDPASGEEVRLVEDAFSPAYSPDGTMLAFDAEWAGPRRIWLADARGRNPRQLTSDSSEAVVHVQPRWSPDGRRLVFRRVEKTVSDIAVVDVATGVLTRVTDDNVLDTDPVWSPSGGHIYFASYRGGGLNVWRTPVDRSGRPTGPP